MRQLILVVLILLAGFVRAQEFPFDVSTEEEDFIPFFDGIKLTSGIWDDPSFEFDCPFPIKLLNGEYKNLHITPEGTGGSIKFSDDVGNFEYMAISIVDLMDRGRALPPKPLSSIRYKTIGTSGDRIFLVQYYNCGFANPITDISDGSDFIHLQMRFYESDGSFEVHYGARNLPNYNRIISDTQGNTLAFFKNFDANYFQDSMYYLKNSPHIPEVAFIENGIVIPDLWQEEPMENQVIRFIPKNVGTKNKSIPFDEKFSFLQSSDLLTIEALEEGSQFETTVYNSDGSQVKGPKKHWNSAELDISPFASGTYILAVKLNFGISSRPFIVVRK